MSQASNPNILYDKASRGDASIKFWGIVPKSMQDAIELIKNSEIRNEFRKTEDGKVKVSRLKNILTSYHKELGIYTPEVAKNIEKLDAGSILMGQQPIIMGGPGFIGNKLGCLVFLYQLAQEQGVDLAPVFFIGDYDGLQKELARQYYPNPISHTAQIIDSEDYLPEESNIAAHAALLPPYEWLDLALEKLDIQFHAFKRMVKGPAKKLLDERWEHIKTLLKTSFTSSDTLSDWATRLWGYITNIIANLGIVFLPTSHPEIRKLVAENYYPFIEKRKLYAKVFKDAMIEIEELGCHPTLPHRHDNYAPFTLECKEDANRVTTTIEEEDGKLFASGECPECKMKYCYEVTTRSDLEKIATIIGPRVDSSQAIFQDIMNIKIRISGPGEIAYYAQALPAVKAIGFDTPVFVKYKRAFYNATWIEALGKQLYQRKQGSLHQSKLFELLRERISAIKEENIAGIRESEDAMQEFIQEQYNKLLDGKQSIDTMKYLGWQFGRFTPEKFGQEVSWIWFDMALQTGLGDYIDTYKRMYNKHSTLGGYYFINCMI